MHEDISSNPKLFSIANNQKSPLQQASKPRSQVLHRQSVHKQRKVMEVLAQILYHRSHCTPTKGVINKTTFMN
jgi:hypothetical protein